MAKNISSENTLRDIYNKYSDMLFRIALMHTGNYEDAMDAVQDVFIKCLEKNISFSSKEHEKFWFIRATINICHNYFRSNSIRRHEDISSLENLSYNQYFSADNLHITNAIQSMPEKLKSVTVLHYLEGYSIDEISKMLKLSSSAVKMRLSRSREMLKSLLEKEDFDV